MKNLFFAITCLIIFTSCKKELNNNTNWTYQLSKVKHSFIATNKELVLNHQKDLDVLVSSINWFSTIPSVANFNSAKTDWIASYNRFNLIQPFLFFDQVGLNQFNFDFEKVDLNNLDPSYIDYTVSNPNNGIIMDTIGYPNIFFADIPQWNLHHIPGSETKITLGYHVLEFLLWGEDVNPSGSGTRTNSDYLSLNTINDRRRTFLTSVCGHLKVANNSLIFGANYENAILQMESQQFASTLFSSAIKYIDDEIAGRVLYMPYNSQNIDHELSRFSDNTKADILSKLNALKYFIDGRDVLQEHNDYFFGDFLKEVDSDKYAQLRSNLDECFSIYQSINGSFDNAINVSSMERVKIYALYLELKNLSTSLKEFQTFVVN